MTEKSFVEMYHATYWDLYRYVSAITFDKNLIEDIIQETYKTAYVKMDILEEHKNIVGWLMLTARYKMLKMYESECQYFIDRIGTDEYLLGRSNGESEIAVAELQTVIGKELTPEERLLLFQYYMDGYTSEELTKKYNISSSCLKMRLKRIRDKLKGCM